MGKRDLSGIRPGSLEAFMSVRPDEISIVSVSKLHPFRNHPFRVEDDEAMDELVGSIKESGVLEPAIVRRDGTGYEILSGHRRKRACEIADIEKIPVRIVEADDDEAAIMMVDANLRREEILPSEKAWAYRIKNEALKHQGKSGGWSVEQLSSEVNESASQIKRYIRLTYLIKDLLDLVDEGSIGISAAVDISFMRESEQECLYKLLINGIDTVTVNEAGTLKKASAEASEPLVKDRIEILLGLKEDPEERLADEEFYEDDEQLNKLRSYDATSGSYEHEDIIEDTVQTMPDDSKLTKSIKQCKAADIILPFNKIKKFFPLDWTKEQKEEVIYALLENWNVQQKYK